MFVVLISVCVPRWDGSHWVPTLTGKLLCERPVDCEMCNGLCGSRLLCLGFHQRAVLGAGVSGRVASPFSSKVCVMAGWGLPSGFRGLQDQGKRMPHCESCPLVILLLPPRESYGAQGASLHALVHVSLLHPWSVGDHSEAPRSGQD